MNQIFAVEYLKKSERQEALDKAQGLAFVYSNKIWQMRKSLWRLGFI